MNRKEQLEAKRARIRELRSARSQPSSPASPSAPASKVSLAAEATPPVKENEVAPAVEAERPVTPPTTTVTADAAAVPEPRTPVSLPPMPRTDAAPRAVELFEKTVETDPFPLMAAVPPANADEEDEEASSASEDGEADAGPPPLDWTLLLQPPAFPVAEPEEAATLLASEGLDAFLTRSCGLVRKMVLAPRDPADSFVLREAHGSPRTTDSGLLVDKEELRRGLDDPAAGDPHSADSTVPSAAGSIAELTTWKVADAVHSRVEGVTCFAESTASQHSLYVAYKTEDREGYVSVFDADYGSALGADVTLRCQSGVTSVAVSPTNPAIVAAGTYSGAVVLWDVRLGVRPVRQSPPSVHTQPVYVSLYGGPSLLTCSTDGRLADWADFPSSRETAQVAAMSSAAGQSTASTVTCGAASRAYVNRLVFGSEDGSVLVGRHTTPLTPFRRVGRHASPVVAVSACPVRGDLGAAGRLILSAGQDWAIGLWSGDTGGRLLDFGRPVADVGWCRSRPTSFAAVGGGGVVAVYDAAESLDAPVDTIALGTTPLCRLHFMEGGGGEGSPDLLAVASTSGTVSVLGSSLRFGSTEDPPKLSVDRLASLLVQSRQAQ